MIEGQEGVTWDQWRALAMTCESAGLEGLFRSDHYSGFLGRDSGGALDAWATLSALAATTERIQLGTLVSPSTFRHPSVLARMAVTASHVSGGRVELGLGAGWNEREHREHGFRFPSTRERMALFAEQLEIVHRSFGRERFDFSGAFYELDDAFPTPKPLGRMNLIVGGAAKPGTLVPAAQFADEYNLVFVSPEVARSKCEAIEEACDRVGRPRLTVSLMTRCVVGEDGRSVERRRVRLGEMIGSEAARPTDATIDGTVDEVVERLREYEEAGVERVMLQHLLHDDLEMVELLGLEVAARVA